MGVGFPAKGYDGQGLDKFLKKGHRTSGAPLGRIAGNAFPLARRLRCAKAAM